MEPRHSPTSPTHGGDGDPASKPGAIQDRESPESTDEVMEAGQSTLLTIDENVEEAVEMFARLSILGHFAKAASFFDNALKHRLHLFPVFAEYASFLSQQGRYDLLLGLVEERIGSKVNTEFLEEEDIHLNLLRALSMLRSQGRLVVALEALKNLESNSSFYSTLTKPPHELSETEIRSVETYIDIITAIITVVPEGSIESSHLITIILPGQRRHDLNTGASPGSKDPWGELQTWCGQLVKDHPQQVVHVLRALLRVLPGHTSTTDWVETLVDSMKPLKRTWSGPIDGPPAVLAKVGAINALLSFISRHDLKPEKSGANWIHRADCLLNPLYRAQRDVRSQQHLELQLRRIIWLGKKQIPGLDLISIAQIAREEANYRLESDCLWNLVGNTEIEFRLWSAAIALTLEAPKVHYIHLILDAVELVAFVTRFPWVYSTVGKTLWELSMVDDLRKRVNLLHMVISIGNCASLRLLLDRGENPKAGNGKGETPLHEAAHKGHEDMARLLLEHDKALLLQCNRSGLSPLEIAADSGRDVLVQLFLESEKDIFDEKGGELRIPWEALEEIPIPREDDKSDQSTALHLAAENGHEAVVLLLLQYQAKLEARDDEGRTALHRALARWHYDVVYLLVRHGADVNSKTNKGQTALRFAAEDGHGAQVELLLEHGADTRVADEDGTTPLHVATRNGHLDVVKILLEYQADVHAKDNNGRTVLHCAAENGDQDLAKLILDLGSDVLSETKDGLWTALHIAADHGHTGIVKLILAHPEGAVLLNWRAGIGPMAKTPKELAAGKGHVETYKLLREARPSEPAS